MDTQTFFISVPKPQTVLIRGILEAYEGWMAVRTICPAEGILELLVPPCFAGSVKKLIQCLEKEHGVKEVPPEILEGRHDLHPL